MPLLIWQVISWSQSIWVTLLLPFIKMVPWQVWAGIAGVIAVLYYGHVREERGYAKCEARVVEATKAEQTRQGQVADMALQAAKQREDEANTKAQAASEALDATQKQVAALKNAKTTCLPKSITDQYRNAR
jgi:hypothetical protein